MGIFSVFNIFKKKQPLETKFELPPLEKTELGKPEVPKMPELPKFEPEPARSFEAPTYREIQPPAPPQPQKDVVKDLELISAKLDTLKVMIDSLGHRLEALERKPRW